MTKATTRDARADFLKMIFKSWTFARLTQEERESCILALVSKIIKGTRAQRWEQLYNVYRVFLNNCGYAPEGWREPTRSVAVAICL
jgi:hypothetical protein